MKISRSGRGSGAGVGRCDISFACVMVVAAYVEGEPRTLRLASIEMNTVVSGLGEEIAAPLATLAAWEYSVAMVGVVFMVDIELMALSKQNVLGVGGEWVLKLVEEAGVLAFMMFGAAYVEGVFSTLGMAST